MMNTKQLENTFYKMIHPSLKDKVFISIEDYVFETDEGIIVLLDENFDELFRFDPRMIHHLFWYLKDHKKNYSKALISTHPLDTVLVLLDKQTGIRCLKDWKSESDDTIKFFYKLREKYID